MRLVLLLATIVLAKVTVTFPQQTSESDATATEAVPVTTPVATELTTEPTEATDPAASSTASDEYFPDADGPQDIVGDAYVPVNATLSFDRLVVSGRLTLQGILVARPRATMSANQLDISGGFIRAETAHVFNVATSVNISQGTNFLFVVENPNPTTVTATVMAYSSISGRFSNAYSDHSEPCLIINDPPLLVYGSTSLTVTVTTVSDPACKGLSSGVLVAISVSAVVAGTLIAIVLILTGRWISQRRLRVANQSMEMRREDALRADYQRF